MPPASASSNASAGDVNKTFPYQGALDFVLTFAPLCRGNGDLTMAVDPGRLLRATRTPDGPATLKVVQKIGSPAQSNADQAGELLAQAWGPGAAYVIERVPDFFALQEEPFDEQQVDGVAQTLAKQSRGLRLAKTWSVFELLVPLVLEQLVTGQESKRAFRNLVNAFREVAPGPFSDLYLPPAPEHLRQIPSAEFISLGILRQQGLTLRRVAERARRLEEAAQMAPEDAFKRLTALQGIGPWTAGSVQLYGLGHADAVVVGDYHLPNMVAWNLAGEDRADDERMLELLDPFAPERGRVLRFIKNAGQTAPRYGPRRAVRSTQQPRWRPRR